MRQTGERMELSRGGEPFDEPFDVAMTEVVISMCWAAGAGRVSLFDSDLVFVQDLAIGAMHASRARDSCGWRRFDLAGGYVGRGSGWLRGGRPFDSLASGAPRLVCGWRGAAVDAARLSDGSIWTVDAGVYKLTAYSADGMRLRSWDIAEANTRDSPHLAIGASGGLYLTEPELGTVAQVAAGGERVITYSLTPADGSLVKPVGIAVDAADNVWVTDVDGGRVLRLAIGVSPTAGD